MDTFFGVLKRVLTYWKYDRLFDSEIELSGLGVNAMVREFLYSEMMEPISLFFASGLSTASFLELFYSIFENVGEFFKIPDFWLAELFPWLF